MNFNIMLNNLKPHLWEMMADSIKFVACALEECEIPVKIGVSQLDPESINLFFDRFYLEPTFPTQMKFGNVKYGIVCTEVISPEGVWNYGAENDAPGTYSAFELAVKNAEFVWCLLEDSLVACKTINPNTVVLPFGYLPQMETIKPISFDEKDIDFLMCGLPSDRRKKITGNLSAEGYEVYYPEMPLPVYLRNSLLGRSKINLSIQKTEHHNTISVSRICHSIINKIPILLEYSGRANRYTDLCIKAEHGEIIETANMCLSESNLYQFAEESYQKLKVEMPMKEMMAEVLRFTFGSGGYAGR